MKVRVKDGMVKHNGRLYGPGEVIEVTVKEAKGLGEAGAIDIEPVVDNSSRDETPPT